MWHTLGGTLMTPRVCFKCYSSIIAITSWVITTTMDIKRNSSVLTPLTALLDVFSWKRWLWPLLNRNLIFFLLDYLIFTRIINISSFLQAVVLIKAKITSINKVISFYFENSYTICSTYSYQHYMEIFKDIENESPITYYHFPVR